MSAHDEWLSLQENESKQRMEYNQRYKLIHSKSKVKSLTALMNGSSTTGSTTTSSLESSDTKLKNIKNIKSKKKSTSAVNDVSISNQASNANNIQIPIESSNNLSEQHQLIVTSHSHLELSTNIEQQTLIIHSLTTAELKSKLSRDLNNAVAEEFTLRKQGLLMIYQILLLDKSENNNKVNPSNLTLLPSSSTSMLSSSTESLLSSTSSSTTSSSSLYEIPTSVYNEIFYDTCKIFFKIFSTDSMVKCREYALKIVLGFFHKMTDFSMIVGYYFPSLFRRLVVGHSYDDNLKIFVNSIQEHEAFLRGRAIDRQYKNNTSSSGSSSSNSSSNNNNNNNITTTNDSSFNLLSSNGFAMIETSEELRLLLCQTLTTLIQRTILLNSTSLLYPYFQDIVLCLQYQLHDSFSDIKIEICLIFEKMAIENELIALMKYYCVGIIRVLLPQLRHRHAKVKIALIRCLQACMMIPDTAKMKGAGTETIVDLIGFQEANVLQIASFYTSTICINYLAELVQDHSTAVRETLTIMLSNFLIHLPDRYDHQTRLLPYLLDLMIDDISSVSNLAWQTLLTCGKLYETEHEEEIKEKKQYGVDGDGRMNFTHPLPLPFTQRPPLGVRLFIRGNISRFVTALLNELTNWQSKTRYKSALLLKSILILCEEYLTSEAHLILPTFIKALQYTKYDQDKVLLPLLYEIFELYGRYTLPEIYLHYLLPRLRGDVDIVRFGVDTVTRENILEILLYVLQGSLPIQILPYYDELIHVLIDEYVIDSTSRRQVEASLSVIHVLLRLVHNVKAMNRMNMSFMSTGRLSTSFRQTDKQLLRFLLIHLVKSSSHDKTSNDGSSHNTNNNNTSSILKGIPSSSSSLSLSQKISESLFYLSQFQGTDDSCSTSVNMNVSASVSTSANIVNTTTTTTNITNDTSSSNNKTSHTSQHPSPSSSYQSLKKLFFTHGPSLLTDLITDYCQPLSDSVMSAGPTAGGSYYEGLTERWSRESSEHELLYALIFCPWLYDILLLPPSSSSSSSSHSSSSSSLPEQQSSLHLQLLQYLCNLCHSILHHNSVNSSSCSSNSSNSNDSGSHSNNNNNNSSDDDYIAATTHSNPITITSLPNTASTTAGMSEMSDMLHDLSHFVLIALKPICYTHCKGIDSHHETNNSNNYNTSCINTDNNNKGTHNSNSKSNSSTNSTKKNNNRGNNSTSTSNITIRRGHDIYDHLINIAYNQQTNILSTSSEETVLAHSFPSSFNTHSQHSLQQQHHQLPGGLLKQIVIEFCDHRKWCVSESLLLSSMKILAMMVGYDCVANDNTNDERNDSSSSSSRSSSDNSSNINTKAAKLAQFYDIVNSPCVLSTFITNSSSSSSSNSNSSSGSSSSNNNNNNSNSSSSNSNGDNRTNTNTANLRSQEEHEKFVVNLLVSLVTRSLKPSQPVSLRLMAMNIMHHFLFNHYYYHSLEVTQLQHQSDDGSRNDDNKANHRKSSIHDCVINLSQIIKFQKKKNNHFMHQSQSINSRQQWWHEGIESVLSTLSDVSDAVRINGLQTLAMCAICGLIPSSPPSSSSSSSCIMPTAMITTSKVVTAAVAANESMSISSSSANTSNSNSTTSITPVISSYERIVRRLIHEVSTIFMNTFSDHNNDHDDDNNDDTRDDNDDDTRDDNDDDNDNDESILINSLDYTLRILAIVNVDSFEQLMRQEFSHHHHHHHHDNNVSNASLEEIAATPAAAAVVVLPTDSSMKSNGIKRLNDFLNDMISHCQLINDLNNISSDK